MRGDWVNPVDKRSNRPFCCIILHVRTLFLIIILITYSIFFHDLFIYITHLFILLLVPHNFFNCILCIVLFHLCFKLYFKYFLPEIILFIWSDDVGHWVNPVDKCPTNRHFLLDDFKWSNKICLIQKIVTVIGFIIVNNIFL